jgi:predicted RNA binding protein YcfA (HicA-like mRNA interferase family)
VTQLDKLIEKIKARPVEADFADVRRLLEAHGWNQNRQKGSHCSFVKPGASTIFTVPLIGGRRVKRVYLVKLCELLGLDD